MENEQPETQNTEQNKSKPDRLLPASIVIASLVLGLTWIYSTGLKATVADKDKTPVEIADQHGGNTVAPSETIEIPVVWGDLGQKMAEAGVYDKDKLLALYASRGGLSSEDRKLVDGNGNGRIKITQSNSGLVLNLLLAVGLANKNEILEKGEMQNPQYGGAGKFASTGGWSLSKGSPMDHFSMHGFVKLTPEQQAVVEKTSQGIYRPCCGNSTHFPDCNHGMAMLGLLKLMASQGASEQDIWKAPLAVNSYWFPDTYLTIAAYMQNKGITWKEIPPQEVLGSSYSSAQGYASIAAQIVQPQGQQGGGGCGVDAGVHQTQQQSGCAI